MKFVDPYRSQNSWLTFAKSVNSLRVSRSHANGAAIAEFLVVIPFLFIVVIGFLYLGQALGQLSWMNNTTFQAAMVGMQSPQATREQNMKNVLDLYTSIHNNSWRNTPMGTLTAEAVDNSIVDPANRTVTATLTGTLSPLWSIPLATFKEWTTAPIILLDQVSGNNITGNPTTLSTCTGDPCPSENEPCEADAPAPPPYACFEVCGPTDATCLLN